MEILFNLGGFVGTSTMVNAQVKRSGPNEISGSFDTMGRLWGGPDVVRIFFVAEFDRPFHALDGWVGADYKHDVSEIQGTTDSKPQVAGVERSYYDASTSGVSAKYKVEAGDRLQVKMAVSYVSVDNAKENLKQSCNHWDFDRVRQESQAEWNEWLGKIDVKGGTEAAKKKVLYSLWHTPFRTA